MPNKITILPDLLTKNLKLVFCGTAAGTLSAQRGHYYAHPQNKFWTTLYEVGLTPRLFLPSEYAQLLNFGIGLTDIAKHSFGMDKELPIGSLGQDACSDLRVRIQRYQPRILALTSATAGRNFLRRPVTFGKQKETIGSTRIWVLPSPSPIAQWNWNEHWWRELSKLTAKLK